MSSAQQYPYSQSSSVHVSPDPYPQPRSVHILSQAVFGIIFKTTLQHPTPSHAAWILAAAVKTVRIMLDWFGIAAEVRQVRFTDNQLRLTPRSTASSCLAYAFVFHIFLLLERSGMLI